MSERRERLGSYIDMKKLERESRRLLFFGLLLGVLFHAFIASVFRLEFEQIVEDESIKVKLIVRKKIDREPFMLRQRPLRTDYRYRSGHRQHIPTEKPDTRKPLMSPDTQLLPESPYAIPDSHVYSQTDETLEEFDNELWSHRNTLPMRLGILDADSGYGTRVVVDPLNKLAIEGYAEIAFLWSDKGDPPEDFKSPVRFLVASINKLTNIRAKQVMLKDADSWQHFHFTYVPMDQLLKHEDPSDALGSGGFVMIDGGPFEYGLQLSYDEINLFFSKLYGGFCEIKPLSKSHTLYHCFFDFDSGPPEGANSVDRNVLYGIFMGNHRKLLKGVYCPQGYGGMWGEKTAEFQRRIAINFVVNALAPGLWADSERRITHRDIATGSFTRWYDNGCPEIILSQRGKADLNNFWIPGSGRVFGEDNDHRMLFDTTKYDRDHANYYFRINEYNELALWGSYNTYEAWHENGNRKYYYNFNDQSYADENAYGNDKYVHDYKNRRIIP